MKFIAANPGPWRWAMILTVASGALSARADYQSTVLSFNPVGYWRLSESAPAPPANVATNAGSLGIIGTGYVTADLTNGEPGIVGNSVRIWNGTVDSGGADAGHFGSRMAIPNRPELNPNGPFTVEFWAKPRTSVTDIYAAISSINGGASRSGWLVYQTAANQWEFRIGGLASYAGTIDSPNGSCVPGAWQHVVGTYDGVNIALYVNGVLAAGPTAATGGAGYNPNTGVPFLIGASGLGNRGWNGWIDEVAFYNGVLATTKIAAHYDAATTNNAGYQAQILLDNPVGYWPLNEPFYTAPNPSTYPVTANLGSAGAAANGTNNPGLLTAVAGPSDSGFGPSNVGAGSGYGAGNVDLGSPAALNFSGPITMTAWIKPTFTDGLRDILGHGFQSDPFNAEVFMRINGGTYEVGSWDGTTYSISAPMNSAGRGSDLGNWVFIAATYDGANWNLYRYDTLVTNAAFATGAILMDAPWSIASAGPNSNGRFLGGNVDEVAIFNTALTTAQIQQIFYSGNVKPIIVTPLAAQIGSGSIFAGTPMNFSVVAEGNKPFTYLWLKNGNSLGNTTTSYSIASLQPADSGTYSIVVSNPAGSTTNSVAVNVLLLPPQVTQQPQSGTRFTGASMPFSVVAGGSGPFTYQWRSNTVNISGATAATYTLSNLQLSYTANYSCHVTGPGGQTDSANGALTVIPAPTIGYPPFPLADNPIAYYRLGESSGTTAHDYWGGHDGTYHSVSLGVPGYSTTDPDTAASFGASDHYLGNIAGIAFATNSSSFSVEAWVNGSSSQGANATIIGKGTGQNGTGGANAWQFVLDVASGKYRFHIEPATGTAGDATATVGPDGTWQHLVATYDAVSSGMSLYVNGVLNGSGGGPAGGPMESLLPISIGAGQGGVTPIHDLPFTGTIDEVAIYGVALSDAQVLNHYGGLYGTTTPPQITRQPIGVTNYVTLPVTLSVSAIGSIIPTPLTYQWYQNNVAIPTGTDATYTIASLANTDAGLYYVHIANAVGQTNSVTNSVGVLAAPTSAPQIAGLVAHLPFDGTYADTTARGNDGSPRGAPTFVPGKVGQAVHYLTATAGNASGGAVTEADYVTLGVRPDFQFGSNVNFTIAYWVRVPLNFVDGDLPFFTTTTNSTFGWGIVLAPSYGRPTANWPGGWAYSLYDRGAANGIGVYGDNGSINDGEWHSLVHVFDRLNGATTYLDGVVAHENLQSGTSAKDAKGIDTGAPATIGQDPTGLYTEPASGDIDEFGVWRRALTPLEAASLYMAGRGGLGYQSAPISLTLAPTGGGQLQLNWTPGIPLMESSNVAGPYTVIPGASPPYNITPTGGQKFYKLAF